MYPDAEVENVESVDAPDAEVAGQRFGRDVTDHVAVNDYVSAPRQSGTTPRDAAKASISSGSASTLSAYKSLTNWC